MNQSYQRTLNELALVKKSLSSQKNSHQNTLQQLENSYRIIEQTKDILKNEQEINKRLKRQISQKTSQIQEMCHNYEEQIISIKDLIDAKDQQIRKFTSMLKVSDYDMIRLRVINEVQVTHAQELQNLHREIKKLEFINNESIFQNNVLQGKNHHLVEEREELKLKLKQIQEQKSIQSTQQLNKIFKTLQQQKMKRKQLQRKIQQQKERYQIMIKKYQQQIQAILNDEKRGMRKQNNSFRGNTSNIMKLSLKQNEFTQENQNLKKQIRKMDSEIDNLKAKTKQQSNELKKKIFDLEKQLQFSQQQLSNCKHEIQFKDDTLNKDVTVLRKQHQRKVSQIKQNYQNKIQLLNKQVARLEAKLKEKQSMRNNQDSNKTFKSNMFSDQQALRYKLKDMERENSSLKMKLKQLQENGKATAHFNEQQGRKNRANSVFQVKDKLKMANTQIVNLLKDKISLNERLAKLQR